MLARFKSTQTVDITVQEQLVPIQHYLRQPHRVIKALVDPSRVENLGQGVFRLKMRPLGFMMLSIQPTVDLKLWAETDGSIALESVNCDIQGIDFINERFNLTLKGTLSPEVENNKTHLIGRADLNVEVNVPPPLAFTPRPIVEATGNRLLSSVLITIKQRLMQQLLIDYREWAIAQQDHVESSPNVALLTSHRSAI
ncbi:MAG: DUF1997 domain-containing protein [Cyanobacteria bacterium P01_A01_bin.37]